MNPNRSTVDEVIQEIRGSLTRAVVDSKHSFRYPVVSTFDNELGVQSRTVVLRKFTSDSLIIFTDRRTPKCEQIHADSRVQFLFYDPRHRVQLRVSGLAQILDEAASQVYLSGMDERATKDYRTVAIPGSPLHKEVVEYEEELYFAAITTQMTTIDYVKLQRPQHVRCKISINKGKWEGSWVVP
ncbi:MAG: pyridoxamine 5'-phosphate oxidase family protein [Bacteroidota bacterium]